MIARYSQRMLVIAWDMTPSADLALKTSLRAGIGLTLLWLPISQPFAEWAALAGKLMLLIAAYGLVGHAEGVFVSHAADKLRAIGGSVVVFFAAIYFGVILLFRTEQDAPWHEQ